ncbi:MAG: choice-of-anchor M domain-containing protein [Acidimicrobiales bacterium]
MSPSRSRRRFATPVLVLAVLVASVVGPPVATAQDAEDPSLDQSIDRDQDVVSGRAALGDGHADLGPRLVDESFALMIHDDATIPSVWRTLDETVLVVGDAALQTVPEDPTYSFLGVDPGTDVHIVPQVQRPGVVWLGWNTQDPAVMERIDRGVTLTLRQVEGPGDLIVYLQSGALGDPEVLWQSTTSDPQPLWVEVNTHTHANWVFTVPGVYLVQVEVSAELVDGSTESDIGTLRFAVGDATETGEAFEASALPDVDASGDADPSAPSLDDEAETGGGVPLLAVIGLGALSLVAGAAGVVVRGNAVRRRAEQERAAERAGERS